MFQKEEFLRFDCPDAARPLMGPAQKEAEIPMASGQLRKLSQEAKKRAPRVYTGRVGRKRGRRGTLVLLPDRSIGNLIMASRGIAVVS